jgi:hypothetical protein
MFVLVVLLAGIAVALIRRRLQVAPAAPTARDDTPARLLGWAAGLLAAEQAEWGQAMLGELDRLDARAQRWRFAIGCAAAALVLPPWGRAAAAAGALAAVAAGGAGLFAYAHIRYGLGADAGTWVWAAILLAFLADYTLTASVLLRRSGAAGPGLAGGLFVAVAWLAVSGFTFARFLAPITWPWARPLLLIAVPAVVGAGGTLRGGSAAAGRRAARLAAVSAGLGLYLYGVIAVAALGAGGPPHDEFRTVASAVDDRLGNQVVFALVLLRLATATVGWAAAAATARLRRAGPAPALPLPARGPGPASAAARRAAQPGSRPARQDNLVSARPHRSDGAPGGIPAAAARRRRTVYLLLLCATVAAAVLLAFISWLRP